MRTKVTISGELIWVGVFCTCHYFINSSVDYLVLKKKIKNIIKKTV